MDSTDAWCLKVLEKWSLLHPVNILGHVSVFWPNYPHLVSKQTQSQNSRGAGRRNVQKGTGALRISKGASCPWQSSLCQGRQPQLRGEALLQAHESKCKMRIGIREVWAGAWESAFRRLLACTPTWTSKALGDQSQPSLRTPAALTPASLIISFKLTHSWKKEKPTIKTLILPHLWVSFFQHIMSHSDNYATSSCSTYLQPKKQRPSINTCYIISTHWILSHSLLKICLFICLSFPFDYQSLEDRAIPCAATWRLTRKEHSVPSADWAQGLHT